MGVCVCMSVYLRVSASAIGIYVGRRAVYVYVSVVYVYMHVLMGLYICQHCVRACVCQCARDSVYMCFSVGCMCRYISALRAYVCQC